MRHSSTSSFLIVLVFVLSLTAPTASPAQKKSEKATPAAAAKPNLGDFDDYVNQALKDWKVPGAAVAVVRGDKVILLKGYGYRDLEKQLPVTPNTLFAIGSITKSFTVSKNSSTSFSSQKPMTRSTPARLYQERLKKTNSPPEGS